jgi:hypothetical protein
LVSIRRRAPVKGFHRKVVFSVLFQAAHRRSEETMHSNYFDCMILGTIAYGQGIANAVEGTHRTSLRNLMALVRGLSLRLGNWRALALKRAAAMAPAMAVCPSYSANRRQRDQRWMSAVVVDPCPVGVR